MNIGLIVAAGRSERFDGGEKQFASLAGRPVLSYSLSAFAAAAAVDSIIIVVREEDRERCRAEVVEPVDPVKKTSIVAGGVARQESVAAGLKACPRGTGLVWVHDGARPLITAAQIDAMAADLNDLDGLILAAPAVDTIKQVEDGVIQRTIPRDQLWQAQTPQLFRFTTLSQAHLIAAQSGFCATDDSALVELVGGRVGVRPNDQNNLKVTTAADMLVAEQVLSSLS